MGIRWESRWEYRGNVGNGLGFPEGRYRIQFAANLDVKVSCRSNPCFSYDHVFATFLRHLWDKTALGVGVIKTRSPQVFSKPRSDRRFWISGPMCTNPWWRSFPGKYVPATGMS